MWQQTLGFIGVLQILLAYFAVQTGVFHSQQLRFSVLNLCGASLVLFSLVGSRSYAAMALEAAWVAVSLIGIWRSIGNKRKAT